MPENNEVLRVAIAILGYWRDHPNAKDSAKGIAQYWVAEPEEIVHRALTILVEEGVITKHRNLYRLLPVQAQRKKMQPFFWNAVLRRLQRKFRST
jgi:hypothetical protein